MAAPVAPEALAWPADALAVGVVVGAWGVRGAVKVAAQSQDAAALRHAKCWWLRRDVAPASPSISISCDVISLRASGGDVVATLAGVTDRDAAQALSGAQVFVPRSAFPRAGDGEFYWVDLIGCEVVNREGVALGRVAGLIDTSVHSVLRVRPADAAADAPEAAERLIPFVDAYVGQVDVAARRIEVDWGLDY